MTENIERAKYSVLLAGTLIEKEKAAALLKRGLKVILFFSDPQTKKEYEEAFERFKDARFFQAYMAPQDVHVEIVDGIGVSEKEEELKLLESFDEAYEQDFNREQYIVEHADVDHHLIIKAGAGTGKTTVMIDRILYLMHTDENFHFSKVAMLTFTRAATDNMRHKLIQRLNQKYELTGDIRYLESIEECAQISISTIHSFFKRVISQVGLLLGYGTNVQLASYVQKRRELVRDIINERFQGSLDEVMTQQASVSNQIGLTVHQIEKLAEAYWERLDNLGLTGEDVASLDWGEATEGSEKLQEALRAIFAEVDRRYDALKLKENAISMTDIIHELSRVIDRADVADYISEKYDYLFCDEFQDSDNVQIKTIVYLNRIYGGRLFVVGDIKQSIYRFRGATDSAFERLEGLLNEAEKQKLENNLALRKNYRTSKTIMNQLDDIFGIWGQEPRELIHYQDEDRLKAMNKKSGEYMQVEVRDKNGALSAMMKKAKEIIRTAEQEARRAERRGEEKKTPPVLTCLVRNNAHLEKVEEKCRTEHLPCVIKKRGTFYTSDAVLDFIGMTEAYLYPKQPMYLYPYAASSFCETRVDLEELESMHGNAEMLREKLEQVIGKQEFEHDLAAFRNQPVMAVLRRIISERDPVLVYGKKQKVKRQIEGYRGEAAVQQAVLDARQYEADLDKLMQLLSDRFSGDFSSLYDICKWLRISILADHTEEQADILSSTKGQLDFSYMQGMTVHASKGLEFDYVMMPFMNTPYRYATQSNILISQPQQGQEDGQEVPEEPVKVGWSYVQSEESFFSNKQFMELMKEETVEVDKDEARLLYVAMTRSIKGLYCYVRRIFPDEATWAYQLPEGKDQP